MAQNSFDFSELKERFENFDFFLKFKEEITEEVKTLVFDLERIKAFTLWFFNHHDINKLATFSDPSDLNGAFHPIQPAEGTKSEYQFAKGEKPIDPTIPESALEKSRIRYEHPMNRDELDKALQLLPNHNDIEKAMNVMDVILKDYMRGVLNTLMSLDAELLQKLFLDVRYMEDNARISNDFRHSLTLIVLFSVQDKLEALGPDQKLSGEDLKAGIREVFLRRAFNSVQRRGKKYECPIKSVFGDLWNINLQRGEDGQWVLADGARHGGFFDAVMDAIGERPDIAAEPEGCPFSVVKES